MRVVRAARLPVINVMLSFIIDIPSYLRVLWVPCIMELNVVARALVDALV